MAKRVKKFTSLRDARERAAAGDKTAQLCIIACLTNLGCEQLADGPGSKWERHYRGFNIYLMSMVGEYGMDEGQAESDLLDELNNARSYYTVETLD